MYKTTAATIHWGKMEADVTAFINRLSHLPKIKKHKRKYGKLRPNDITTVPGQTVRIYLVGPYQVTDR